MKRIICSLLLLSTFTSLAQIDPQGAGTQSASAYPDANQKRVQIAILFDTSNSMDGLIAQAKSRIWAIINTISNLRYNGQAPFLEIALYDYGNDNLTNQSNYVRKIIPLTTDLDLVSQKLFSLTTFGGSEYCGAVISQSLQELAWTSSPYDLRMIYIAGNEPFNQGPIPYKQICSLAAQRDIQVNTIYCGDYDQGVKEFWYDGAQSGKGEYSNINSNREVVHYTTPYDEKITRYNDSLNRTYIQYGENGAASKRNQLDQDENAKKMSLEVVTERAIVKSKAAYTNASWDVVDAVTQNSAKLDDLKDEDLPDEMKGMTEEEKRMFVEKMKAERYRFQKIIQELSVEREAYIAKEKEKSSSGESDFGNEVNENIVKTASEKGFTIQQ